MKNKQIIPTRIAHGEKIGDISAGIIMVSDSLFESIQRGVPKEDVSGKLCRKLLEKNSIAVRAVLVVPDSVYEIRSTFRSLITQVQLVITIGGTGSTPRDLTIEAITLFVDKKFKGFGERFRGESFPEIGNAVIMTRTFLGVADKTLVCCLPGSPHAVKLGIETVLLPELRHLLKHIDV